MIHCPRCLLFEESFSKTSVEFIGPNVKEYACKKCGHKWMVTEQSDDTKSIPEDKVLKRIDILPVEHTDAHKDSNVAVDDVVINYTQNGDSQKPDDTQELKVRTVNNGISRYLVFETERWAISNVDELIEVLEDFRRRAGLK